MTGPGAVQIPFAESPHDVCTADMAPTTHVFGLPESVVERPVDIMVTLPNGHPVWLPVERD